MIGVGVCRNDLNFVSIFIADFTFFLTTKTNVTNLTISK